MTYRLSHEDRNALDVMGMFPTPEGFADPSRWEQETGRRLFSTVEAIVARDRAEHGAKVLREAARRPYAPDTPLVVVSETEWDDAETAMSDVTDLQDALANANAYAERMPEKIADYLLTHVGGDESQPWQAGHNYAMTEAARLVRERYFALDEGDTGGAS